MARVFTISFTYNEKDYTAVISEAQGSITIYIPDEDLQSMLPSSRLTFHPEKGVETDTPLNEKAKHLVRNILEQTEIRLGQSQAPKEQQR